MSTNYFLEPFDPTAREYPTDADGAIHLGKSSQGWPFLAQAYPQAGINDLRSWLRLLTEGKIVADAGYEVPLHDFLRGVLDCAEHARRHALFPGQTRDGGVTFDPADFC
jgi:hypothetical protein